MVLVAWGRQLTETLGRRSAQGKDMSQKTKRNSKFDALIHTIVVYDREVKKCERGRAFLAGCILQGALLEASLTAMALVYRESVWKTAAYKKVKNKVWKNSKRPVRWLRDFSLNDLQKVAAELGWVSVIAEVGTLRNTRNLVHPGKYADELGRKERIGAASYRSQYVKLSRITGQLYKKLESSLARKLAHSP